jgi:hypothetical protein
MRRVLSRIRPEEWREIRRRILGRPNRGRFPKGHVPWTKGRRGIHLSPATEFQPGCLRGAAARHWRPIGTIVIRFDKPPKRVRGRKRKNGLGPWRGRPRRWIKVRDFGPTQYRWTTLARWNWERARGPILPGMRVIHANGDSLDDRLENYRLADAAGHLRHYDLLEPERVARRRAACGRANSARHAANRLRRAEGHGERRVWLCPACGWSSRDGDPQSPRGSEQPNRCPKCGGCSLERTELDQARKGARP